MIRRNFLLSCPLFLMGLLYFKTSRSEKDSITVIATVVPPHLTKHDPSIVNTELSRLMNLGLYFSIINEFKDQKLILDFKTQTDGAVAARIVLKDQAALSKLRTTLENKKVFNHALIRQTGYRIEETVI